MNNKFRYIRALVAIFLVFTLISCNKDSNRVTSAWASSTAAYGKNDTWAFYLYLCGTDLETKSAAATMDLIELMQAELGDNIEVVIMAGGAKEWHNTMFDSDYLNIAHYDSEGLGLIDQWPLASMGESETLYEFLEYCISEFPADHQAVLFWDHGGGSIGGICYDELHKNMLGLNDLEDVFSLLDDNYDQQFELVGFDACLMATLETAGTLSPYAYWMVASEDIEPGRGWDYTGIFSALSENPGMNGGQLGKVICDTYYSSYEGHQTQDALTLSVVDLSKIPALIKAYNNVGIEALRQASVSIDFFGEYGRAATKAENYMNNGNSGHYTNMVDLGDLVHKAGDILPDSGEQLLKALDDAVYYSVNGKYRKGANGLTTYYSFDGNYEKYSVYEQKMVNSTAFAHYYHYMLTGEPKDDVSTYLAAVDSGLDDTDYSFDDFDIPGEEFFQGFPVVWDEEYQGSARLDLGLELGKYLVGVFGDIGYIEDDYTIWLGQDPAIHGSWGKEGSFYDNFNYKWFAIDGAFLYMEVTDIPDDEDDNYYVLYWSPILLNGEECSLNIVAEYEEDNDHDYEGDYVKLSGFKILSVTKGLDDNGLADRSDIQLKPGDIIEPLFYVSHIGEDGEYQEGYEWNTLDSIEVSENTSIEMIDLWEGMYMLVFEMWDFQGNRYVSDQVYFQYEDDEYYYGHWDDFWYVEEDE